MTLWVRIVTPLVWAIRGASDGLTTRIVGEEKAAENILHVDELRTLVETSAEEGEINATERALIHNLLEAGDTEIVEIMTPRTRTNFIEASLDVHRALDLFRRYRHPRVPVYRGSRDNLVGFLHAEDIVRIVFDDADLSAVTLDDLLRPPVVVPLTKKVDEMFDFFQANQARAAAVLNEFGGVEGFVTMKDVLTFIFGQISGEIRGQEHYEERDEDIYEVPGEMKLTDFDNLTNFGIMIRHFGEHGDLLAFLVFTPLFLILGEIVPKSVYQQKSDDVAPVVVYPLRGFSLLLYPIVFVFSRAARLAARMVGVRPAGHTPFMTREPIRSVADMAERTSTVSAFDRSRIRRVIRFAETTVGEAMIPVAEIAGINERTRTAKAVELVRRHGYNRLPLYRGNISNIVGVVTLTTWDLIDPGLARRPPRFRA